MAKLTAEFQRDTSEKIKQVAKEYNITPEELLRRALGVYIYLLHETRDGRGRVAIIATGDDKVIKNIELSFP